MVLDVVVCSGKQHSAAHARPGLGDILDSLNKDQLPALVRGDCGFGNEPFIVGLENRDQPYLFKLRQASGVKKMLMRQFARKDWITSGSSDQGWSAVEDTLRLAGWDKSRRVVILRRPAKSYMALTRKATEGQMELLLPDQDVELWEYAVLVTNSGYPLESTAQLYRGRADAENGFDELKNQWGWGGFTTQDIERCQSSACLQLVELVLPRGQAGGLDGGHCQQGFAAGRRGPSHQACRTDDALSDADVRCNRDGLIQGHYRASLTGAQLLWSAG